MERAAGTNLSLTPSALTHATVAATTALAAADTSSTLVVLLPSLVDSPYACQSSFFSFFLDLRVDFRSDLCSVVLVGFSSEDCFSSGGGLYNRTFGSSLVLPESLSSAGGADAAAAACLAFSAAALSRRAFSRAAFSFSALARRRFSSSSACRCSRSESPDSKAVCCSISRPEESYGSYSSSYETHFFTKHTSNTQQHTSASNINTTCHHCTPPVFAGVFSGDVDDGFDGFTMANGG
mmetsp:Transcript_21169/g.36077  ORF Transcript_21169/g.36077 Transcript_21169/m.36077 type:complete len:237 (-) Transcript_21169:798-1508(-)